VKEVIYNSKKNSLDMTINNGEKLPDIYFIVLDAHTSANSLKQYWDYDESGFIDSLKKLGFFVADSSRSLTKATRSSTASTFELSRDSVFMKLSENNLIKIINENTVTSLLNKAEYTIYNLTPFYFNNIKPAYKFGWFYDQETILEKFFSASMFIFVIKHIEDINFYKTNLKILEKIESISRTVKDNPKFVFAHIMLPHPPYNFDRDGNLFPWYRMYFSAYSSAGYLEQLIGSDKIYLEFIRKIIKNTSGKSIIIIQADHGFRFLNNDIRGEEGYTILNTFYFPDKDYKLLSNNINRYNTFRVLIKKYFDKSFTLLSNSNN